MTNQTAEQVASETNWAADHYKALWERACRENDSHKAMLFDAYRVIRGQGKGLQRQARRIRRLRGEVDRLDKKCSALALLAYGEIQPVDSPSAICAIIGCKEREEHLHFIAHPPELAPGSSQTQPNLAAPESGTGAASSLDVLPAQPFNPHPGGFAE